MLRAALLNVGVQAGVLMLRAGTTPEDVAKRVGLPADTIYQIMTGREEDIGIRALNALAKLLNGKLIIQLVPDDQTRAA
jgi:predicted transcriptional regulator